MKVAQFQRDGEQHCKYKDNTTNNAGTAQPERKNA